MGNNSSSIISNNNKNNNNNDINKEFQVIFYKVFKNLKLKKLIINYSNLFKKNEIMEFKDLKSLKEYKEKEFINHLIYSGDEMIKIGDLNGFDYYLETIEFKNENNNNYNVDDGSIIPKLGIKNIIFPKNNKKLTKINSYPNTVESFENLIINDRGDGCIMSSEYFFPKQIKSISFLNSSYCPDLSYGYLMIIFENQLESLSFNDCSRNLNEKYPFSKIILFLPSSIKNLKVIGLNSNLNAKYLPSSLINLSLGILNSNCLDDFNQNNHVQINLPINFKNFELEIQIPTTTTTSLHNDNQQLIYIPKNIEYLILRNINNYYRFVIPSPPILSSRVIEIEFHFCNDELNENIKLKILKETFSSQKKGSLKLLKITGLNKKININEFI